MNDTLIYHVLRSSTLHVLSQSESQKSSRSNSLPCICRYLYQSSQAVWHSKKTRVKKVEEIAAVMLIPTIIGISIITAAISWHPPLISQLFSPWPLFFEGCSFYSQLGCLV